MLFLYILSLYEKNKLLSIYTNKSKDTKLFESPDKNDIIDKDLHILLDICDMIDWEFKFLYEFDDTE